MKKLHILLALLTLSVCSPTSAQEITVTIGYPDHEDYFIYSIPPSDEHARFGGEYYFKVENTGSVALNNFELFTIWKTLNSTWGVVEKTVLNASTGEIKLTGPSWDTNLDVGESFELNGEWIATSSVEDWIDFLPRDIQMTADGYSNVNVVYDTQGTISAGSYEVQKTLPITNDRKTFSDLKVVAYFPIFDAERAWCSLQKYGQNIDQLRVQLYSISPNGELRAGQDLPSGVDPITDLDFWYDSIVNMGVVQYCQDNGIEFVPVVYNYNGDINDFDQQAVHNMMTTPAVRTAHLADLNQLIIDHPEFSGIDIDYESLMAIDRDNYSLFMEDLSVIVHNHNKILTTAVHTKAGPGTWYGPQAQDYQRLGNAVDEMLLMTYDLHWATSPTFSNPPPTAGCQSTPDWMNDVAMFAVSEVDDPSKIQLGLPFYGYRWKHLFENHTLNDPGEGLTYEDALDLMNQHGIDPNTLTREPNGQERNFIVNIDGTDWIGYYQDGPALSFKLESLDEYDLRDFIGGVGIWRLGGENDEMWEAVMQSVKGTNAIVNSNIDCSTGGNSNSLEETQLIARYYPNPVENELTIERTNSNPASIQLLDITGKLIHDFGQKNGSIISLNFAPLNIAEGTYFLKIGDDSGTVQTVKILSVE